MIGIINGVNSDVIQKLKKHIFSANTSEHNDVNTKKNL